MQWQCLSVPTDPTGQPVMHDTTVSKVFARWLARYIGDTIAHVPYVYVFTGKAHPSTRGLQDQIGDLLWMRDKRQRKRNKNSEFML